MQLNLQSYQPWLDYTLYENQSGVFDILEDFGYPEPQSPREFLRTVDNFIRDYGEEAIETLKTAHPDYDMFMRMRSIPVQPAPALKTTISTAAPQPVNTQNTQSAEKITQDDKDFIKKAVTVGLVIIGVVQILKILNHAS